jgi:hypothetical protein
MLTLLIRVFFCADLPSLVSWFRDTFFVFSNSFVSSVETETESERHP